MKTEEQMGEWVINMRTNTQEYTVIRFDFKKSAKLGICTVVGLNGILVEANIRTWDT